MMRVAVATLGCKVNRYDTAVIEQRLDARGFTRVAFDDEADAYVVNSCTVTDRADRDARRLARKARRRNGGQEQCVLGFRRTAPFAFSPNVRRASATALKP